MFNITELPANYIFNDESLSDGKYIDDNSLFVYQLLARGKFANMDTETTFFHFHPFEWTTIDFVAFLLSVSKKYDLEIQNIKTNFSPIEEEYQLYVVENEKIKHGHHGYRGAYNRIIGLEANEEKNEEVELFNKFLTDTATVADVERLLIYADRTVPFTSGDDTQIEMSKEIFTKIIEWTTFSIAMTAKQKIELDTDLQEYMEAFIHEQLVPNHEAKRIGDTSVTQSKNIFTFKKHSTLFREYLQKMWDDFGNTVTIENTFESRFPNEEYPNEDVIRSRYAKRNFYFIHIFFAFEKQGFLKIISLGNTWNIHEDEMLAYQTKIEILPAFQNEALLKKLYFDEDKARFYVQGKEIKLLKFKDEYHTLRIMFQDPKELPKEWFFSEIAELIDESNLNDKKYYNAIYQLGLKLAKVGISDFFTTTKQSVKINSKYLS